LIRRKREIKKNKTRRTQRDLCVRAAWRRTFDRGERWGKVFNFIYWKVCPVIYLLAMLKIWPNTVGPLN